MFRLCAVFIFALLATTQFGHAQNPPAVPAIAVETVELPPPVMRSHGIAMHGRPKYDTDFSHFDYVNPDAPKGGMLRFGSIGTFDSFNPFIVKGVPGAGSLAAVETLMTGNEEEELFSYYGLLAETIEWPEDRAWVAFELRPEARWHDGAPVTADDVVFSFETLQAKGHPLYRNYFGSVETAEKLGERKVRFNFVPDRVNRELPLIMGQLPVMPKHYWEGRDFTKTTLEPPLGSGPYRITDFEPGRFVEVERVEDYWGKDLAVNIGRHNFDKKRYEYYRDMSIRREALKAGEVDFMREYSSKSWARDFDTPARRAGWLELESIPHQKPIAMQAFVFNSRRPQFRDRRVRRALSYAFDFEWTNRVLFFDLYERTTSFFENTELASSGLPSAAELEILEPYRGRIPDEVFTEPYQVPTTDGSGWIRENLREALRLLDEAGWEVRDLQLVNRETGEPLSFEILLVQESMQRVVLPMIRNLERMGVKARIQVVDTSQYYNRVNSFDFDMTTTTSVATDSPGNEQRDYWSSAVAEQPGSSNLAGIADPVIDELVELVISAPNRQTLVERSRALDRVLLWGHYFIPHYGSKALPMVIWDKFGRPPPTRLGTTPDTWWYDAEKAAALERARKQKWPVRTDQHSVLRPAEHRAGFENAG